jgi:hypothetical protein
MFLHKVGNSSAVHSLSWSSSGESLGGSDELVHDVVSMNIIVFPWARFESKGDLSLWGFSPLSVFSTNILGSFSDMVVFWNWEHISESFLNKVNIFFMVLDSTSNNKALSWGDVIHNKLLDHSCVNVINIFGKSKSWHTKSVVAISGS